MSLFFFQGSDNAVDITSLLRSCVQSAVSMLSDHVKSGFRSTRRVAILLTLLSDNDETKGKISHAFLGLFLLQAFQ